MAERNALSELDKLAVVRGGGRKADDMREVKITMDYIPSASGSALIECGNTRVICVATIEDRVPKWLYESKAAGGWVTAEYSLLPYAGGGRKMREATAGKLSGRTQEIQRMIGRALRSVVDLAALGERTIWIDCDVIQADGGTRTASVTGGFLAMYAMLHRLIKDKKLRKMPLTRHVAAVSVGIVNGAPMLDLDYSEDSIADVDFNVVMTDSGEFIEIQGTAEERPFSAPHLAAMLALAERGCARLLDQQKTIIDRLA